MSKSSDTEQQGKYKFIASKILSDSRKGSRAKVAIFVGETPKEAEGRGEGPIDALFDAIFNIVDLKVVISELSAKSVSDDAGKEVSVLVDIVFEDEKGGFYSGKGHNVDIVVASAIALLDVLNQIDKESLSEKEKNRQSFVEDLIRTNVGNKE